MVEPLLPFFEAIVDAPLPPLIPGAYLYLTTIQIMLAYCLSIQGSGHADNFCTKIPGIQVLDSDSFAMGSSAHNLVVA